MPKRLVPLVLVVLAGAGCGGGASSGPAGDDGGPRATAGSSDSSEADSNEIHLTRAESLKLVHWATSFRDCMAGRGVSLGPLETTATHITMSLLDSTAAADVLPDSTACGERLGNPPRRSSLQLRPDESTIYLYLPKRCLLDEKVAAES